MNHPPTLTERLRYNILFESLSDEQFNLLLPKLQEYRFCAGEIILEDESDGDDLFLLVEGRVKITKPSRVTEEKLIALLHPGDFFGELELVDGRPRSARVTALDDCVAHSLCKSDFESLLQESHPFAIRLMQVLSIRLRASNKHFVSEITHNALRARSELQKLEQLIDASKALNSTLDLDRLLDIILETALHIVDGDRGTVYLVDEEKDELWSKVLKGSEVVRIRLPMGKGIAGYVAATGDTLNIQEAYLDPRFNPEVDKQSGYRTRTILCMPMKNKDDEIIGVFQLLNKRDGVFTREDESILAALSVHAAIAIEKARLYEEEKALLRIQEELRLAAQIQHDLLPKSYPRIPGYEVAGTSIPARQVGGDYFDFIPIDDHRWAICIADVSGKGLPAALLMANVQATLRGQSLVDGGASECVSRSNKLLFRSTSSDKFVTLFYGVLDTRTHQLRFCNAGHDFPIFLPESNRPARLETGGIVLGIMEQFPFADRTTPFQPGDVLVMYSDGIVEATNANEQMFGEDRLLSVLKKCRTGSAREIMEGIISSVKRHIGSHPQWDDMTMVVAKRNETARTI